MILSRRIQLSSSRQDCSAIYLAYDYTSGEEISGVEPNGTIKALEKMLKGVVGEAGPMFKDEHQEGELDAPTMDSGAVNSDFNGVNYWRNGYSQPVVED